MNARMLKFVVGFVIVTMIAALSGNISVAQEGALKPLKVVQLGDSYSAGNGARSTSGDRNYHGVEGCYRSPTNWGSQFVNSLGDKFAVTYVNRACSGGVINNILNQRVMDYPFKKLDGSCPSPAYPDEEIIEADSTLKCRRSLRPQIDAIDTSTDLVLLTIGGNDVEFANIVKQCFVTGFRDPGDCRDAVEHANNELENVERRLIETLGRIRAKLRPDAKVVLVTYSHLMTNVGYRLHNRLSGDNYDAAQGIRALGEDADKHQRSAVKTANAAAGQAYVVLYDGTKALFAGHEPDPSASSRNADRWLHEFETRVQMEWYHYNPLGHQNLGSALSRFGTFGAGGRSLGTGSNIDVAFVVDTTGSMGDVIDQVRADLSNLVNQLAATTDSYRVAVVSYRDFPERTGDSEDYPSRVDQTFTDNLSSIQAAIDSLTANGGGDWPETVFSGIQSAIELPWRPGVTKIALVIGDAEALSPEPISNLTADQIIANSLAVDPVQVIGVDTGNINANGALGEVAAGTGGSIIPGTSELTTTISEILGSAAKQPLAWLGTAYSGKIGQPVLFDASGSYDPSGVPISRYEWDFDGDGTFDLATTEATATHVYDAAFNDYVILRVTGAGGTALASARTVVNAEGFASQGDEAPCALDENGFSIIVDEEGQFIRCTPDSLPTVDQEGVIEIIGGYEEDERSSPGLSGNHIVYLPFVSR